MNINVFNIGPESEKPVPFHAFFTKNAYVGEDDGQKDYFLSVNLKSGINRLDQLYGEYSRFPLIGATCQIKEMNLVINVPRNSVIYLGHINSVIRERANDSEKRAGSLFPLIDQRVAGFSNGTFDVFIEDKFDEDMKVFVREYPGLQNVQVKKDILPQWERPESRGIK